MNRPLNIVIIVVDTLRKDYGERFLSPVLDRYGYTYYSNAIAAAPWTIPSHASMLTGLYPSTHGAHETRERKILDVTLSTQRQLSCRLAELGYSSYLFSENPLVSPITGLRCFSGSELVSYDPSSLLPLSAEELRLLESIKSRGFKRFYSLIRMRRYWLATKLVLRRYILQSRLFSMLYGVATHWPSNKGITRLLEILRESSFRRPAFVLINLMEVHEPYPGISTARYQYYNVISWATGHNPFGDKYRRGYEEALQFLSTMISRLVGLLEDLFGEDTVYIITSDHGQLLGEGGRISHGVFLDDELVRVPLWIKAPFKLGSCSENSGMYISLTSIYNFVLELAWKRKASLNSICRETVYSEAHGVHLNYHAMGIGASLVERLTKLDTHKVAIYHQGIKIVFNTDNKEIEEIKFYKDLDKNEKRLLVKEALQRLRAFTLRSKRLRAVSAKLRALNSRRN